MAIKNVLVLSIHIILGTPLILTVNNIYVIINKAYNFCWTKNSIQENMRNYANILKYARRNYIYTYLYMCICTYVHVYMYICICNNDKSILPRQIAVFLNIFKLKIACIRKFFLTPNNFVMLCMSTLQIIHFML